MTPERLARNIGGICIAVGSAWEFGAITGIAPIPTISRVVAKQRHRAEVRALVVAVLAVAAWHLLMDEMDDRTAVAPTEENR